MVRQRHEEGDGRSAKTGERQAPCEADAIVCTEQGGDIGPDAHKALRDQDAADLPHR